MGFWLRTMTAAALVVFVAGTASALSFTFEMGDDSLIDTSGTNEELIMWAQVYDSVANEVFTLDEGGSSYTFLFARMGTTEDWIQDDDLLPGNVFAEVDIDVPDLTSTLNGITVGFSAHLAHTQGWTLSWDGPQVVDFGNGGQFTIELSDAGFQSGGWQGPDGRTGDAYADIYATVTLNSAPISDDVVPEPATLSLLGLGIAGLAMRRKLRTA